MLDALFMLLETMITHFISGTFSTANLYHYVPDPHRSLKIVLLFYCFAVVICSIGDTVQVA